MKKNRFIGKVYAFLVLAGFFVALTRGFFHIFSWIPDDLYGFKLVKFIISFILAMSTTVAISKIEDSVNNTFKAKLIKNEIKSRYVYEKAREIRR
ncbi:MAG: hypothetical protein Q7U56_11210, partial [Humidesulfovibrio sp.]|nr:hypothetical protein [Humidesulfovibrio sp.]